MRLLATYSRTPQAVSPEALSHQKLKPKPSHIRAVLRDLDLHPPVVPDKGSYLRLIDLCITQLPYLRPAFREDLIGTGPPQARTEVIYVDLGLISVQKEGGCRKPGEQSEGAA